MIQGHHVCRVHLRLIPQELARADAEMKKKAIEEKKSVNEKKEIASKIKLGVIKLMVAVVLLGGALAAVAICRRKIGEGNYEASVVLGVSVGRGLSFVIGFAVLYFFLYVWEQRTKLRNLRRMQSADTAPNTV